MTESNLFHVDRSTPFCVDCVFNHEYRIAECFHTLCLPCLSEAIHAKIELKSDSLVCPRCNDAHEIHRPFGNSSTQRPNHEQPSTVQVVHMLNSEQHSSCNDQTTPTLKPIQVTESDSIWSTGTESWHVHDIKPQRERFMLMPVKQIERADTSLNYEDLPELSVNNSLPIQQTPQASNRIDRPPQSTAVPNLNSFRSNDKSSLRPKESSQRLSVAVSTSKHDRHFDSSSHTPSLKQVLKLPANQNEWTPDICVFNSLLCSGLSTRTTSQTHSVIRSLRMISHDITVLVLLLFSILVPFGILYDLAYVSNTIYARSSTPASKLVVDMIASTFLKRRISKLVPVGTTIEILRNLESFWIYAIT